MTKKFLQRKDVCFPDTNNRKLCTGAGTKALSPADACEVWLHKRFSIGIFCKRLNPQEYAWALDALDIHDDETDTMLDFLSTCPFPLLRNQLIKEYARKYLK